MKTITKTIIYLQMTARLKHEWKEPITAGIFKGTENTLSQNSAGQRKAPLRQ